MKNSTVVATLLTLSFFGAATAAKAESVLSKISLPAVHAERQATYTVPVPDALKAHAVFQIDEPQMKVVDGQINLIYRMPADLVGPQASPIVLNGALSQGGGDFHLSGPQADADCSHLNTQIQCQVAFKNLNVDIDAIASSIVASTNDPAEIQARLAVSQAFVADPHGVLLY